MNKFKSLFNILTITIKNNALGTKCTTKISNLIFSNTHHKSKIRHFYIVDYLDE
jgi:hypothetical protein